MEFLRNPLYSILSVILIGAVCGAAADLTAKSARKPRPAVAVLPGVGAAFIGFHLAMLSNVRTDLILMPFGVALLAAGLIGLLMRKT